MKECAFANKLLERRFGFTEWIHKYHSVEFSIDGLCVPHQFRIWNIASTPMCVLVKKDSGILPLLSVGDTLNLKYYLTGSTHPTEYLKTAIQHITKHDQGRFKGHYLVGLQILERG
jgi:hypothetical protein